MTQAVVIVGPSEATYATHGTSIASSLKKHSSSLINIYIVTYNSLMVFAELHLVHQTLGVEQRRGHVWLNLTVSFSFLLVSLALLCSSISAANFALLSLSFLFSEPSSPQFLSGYSKLFSFSLIPCFHHPLSY